MLTAEGCRIRRARLLSRLGPTEPLVLADPISLRYLAGCHVDPFSLGGDYRGVLILDPDGSTRLILDDKLPASARDCHVDRLEIVPWYDGQSPARGPRRLVPRSILVSPARVHDAWNDPDAERFWGVMADLRRAKDPDEIAILKECCRAAERGHAWALSHLKAGMSEVEVYAGIAAECVRASRQAVIVYGDFAVSPGPKRRGGPPTDRVLRPGEMLILDFSVVIGGYRCDFSNTVVIDAEPTANQRRLSDLCQTAMAAGESKLGPGVPCQVVYDALRQVFIDAGMAEHFPHHAGHGLGLAHPEPPFIVRQSTETLQIGDVITLEPGLYVDGIGGIRIEHNYLITPTGYDRLSQHDIRLRP